MWGALSAAVCVWDLLKEFTIIFITSTIVCSQVKQRGENTSTENWIKDLLSLAPTIRTRPNFPHSQSLPSGSFHKPVILIHQGADSIKTTITESIKLITRTTALSNSMKLLPTLCRATQDGQVMVKCSNKTWSTGEDSGKPLQHSCLENPINSMKRQKYI